jgi:CheY-like chemotaxis protein
VSTGNMKCGPPVFPEDPPQGEYVHVSVSDTGIGMAEHVLRRVFEPFFTTKEVGKGSGLGLSQVLGFAKQSGGGVHVQSQPGRGTTVSIYLPRAQTAPPLTPPARRTEPSSVAGDPKLLLVDDDGAVRDVIASMLRDLGYRVVEAGSGGAALDVLDGDSEIDLVVLDFAMPGMNGAELARRIGVRHPGLPILFVTGYADRTAFSGVSESRIVGKPFNDDELTSKIASALAAASVRKTASARP